MSKNKHENFTPTLFSEIFNDAKLFSRNWLEKEFGQSFPAVNIHETGKDFNLEFAAPGFSKNDFKVSVDGGVLTVKAEKQQERNEETKRYTRREYSFNSFSRSFTLPENSNPERIDARYDNGILHVVVSKLTETPDRQKKDITVS